MWGPSSMISHRSRLVDFKNQIIFFSIGIISSYKKNGGLLVAKLSIWDELDKLVVSS